MPRPQTRPWSRQEKANPPHGVPVDQYGSPVAGRSVARPARVALPPGTTAADAHAFERHLDASREHLDRVAKAIEGLNRGPQVLETRTVTLAAASQLAGQDPEDVGTWTADRFRVPYAAVALSNLGNAQVIVSTGPDQGSAPGGGQGQVVVPATSFAAWNMKGSSLTIYGPVGTTVSFTVFTDTVPPVMVDWGSNTLAPFAASLTGYGKATGPAAAANLAQTGTLQTGVLYSAAVSYYLNGTTASPADDDNMRLGFLAGGNFTPIGTLLVNGVAGAAVDAPTTETFITPPAPAGATLVVQVTALATATAIYHTSIAATPLAPI